MKSFSGQWGMDYRLTWSGNSVGIATPDRGANLERAPKLASRVLINLHNRDSARQVASYDFRAAPA
jgi:hypothetical protein